MAMVWDAVIYRRKQYDLNEQGKPFARACYCVKFFNLCGSVTKDSFFRG